MCLSIYNGERGGGPAFATWIKKKYFAENLFISTSSSLFLEYGYSSKHFPSLLSY